MMLTTIQNIQGLVVRPAAPRSVATMAMKLTQVKSQALPLFAKRSPYALKPRDALQPLRVARPRARSLLTSRHFSTIAASGVFSGTTPAQFLANQAQQSESRFKRPVDQSSATKGRSSIAGEGLNSPARA
eukprot:1192743-Prorocentrum_minimum.AAC.2